MKALTLTQPWAQLMADGRKRFETRSWYPWSLDCGELLAITASARIHNDDREYAYSVGYRPSSLPLGSVVAVVRFLEAHKTQHVTVSDEERAFGFYEPDRFAWQCELVLKLDPPLGCRGAQSIWKLPAELEDQVATQLEAAKV